MEIALTTRWNAGRHVRGEDMIDEILALCFPAVELGYDLRLDLVEGVKSKVREGAVRVTSLHNFCPLPIGAPKGHPEIFTFGNDDGKIRENAVHHTARTIEFAAELGAKVVVSHSGYVMTRRRTRELIGLAGSGNLFSPAFDKLRMKLQISREKKAPKYLGYLAGCLDQLVPVLQQHNVVLALENLPTWEALPSETEIEALAKQFQPWIRCWYDIGHGQIRENLGFINHLRWLERLQPILAGMHVHDVANRFNDHVMPPRGDVAFDRMKEIAQSDILRVIEPTPHTSAEDIQAAHEFLQDIWSDKPSNAGSGEEPL